MIRTCQEMTYATEINKRTGLQHRGLFCDVVDQDWYKNPEYVKPLFNGCSEAFDIAAKVLADHRDIGLDAENVIRLQSLFSPAVLCGQIS